MPRKSAIKSKPKKRQVENHGGLFSKTRWIGLSRARSRITPAERDRVAATQSPETGSHTSLEPRKRRGGN